MTHNALLDKVSYYSVNLQYLLLESGNQILHVSPGIHDLLGYDAKGFIEKHLDLPNLIHSDDQDIAINLFSLNLQKTPKIINFRCRQANGKIICLQGCYQKHYDNSARLKLVLQLTDAKSLNQYLDDPILLKNFTTLMKNSEDYIYFKDRNHVFTGASQTLVSLTNPSEHWTDLIGKTDYDVFSEEYADAYYRLEKQIFSGISVAQEIQKTVDNQGNIGWVDNRKYPIFDNNNEIIGLFGIAHDVTETIINQQKVKQLLSEQSAILENQLISFVTVKDRKAVWANPAFVNLFGYSQKELMGMPSRKLYLNEEDYQSIDAAYTNIGHQDIVRNGIKLLSKDGRQICVNISGKTLNKEEGLSLWSFIDVTEVEHSELALKSSEMRFRTLFESNSDAVMLLDSDSFFTCNKATLAIFGCSTVQEFCAQSLSQLSPLIQACGTNSLDLAKQKIEIAKQQGSLNFEWLYKRIDNDQTFPAEVLLSTITLDNKQVVQAVVRDITKRKQVEEERNEALNLLQKISENVPGMVYQFRLNADGHSFFPYASPAIQDFFRVTPEEAKESATHLFTKIHPEDYDRFIASIKLSKENFTQWHEEFRVQFSDGTVNWLLGTSLPERSDEGAIIWHGFVTDITERKKMEEQIHKLAFYDELTALPNRRLLNDRLNQAMAASNRSARYGAVMILDLDNFKPLNDNHGHLVGDLLLVEVASRLISCVREIDTVARFGGDEFVVMLNRLDTDKATSVLQAKTIAKKVCTSLAEPYFLTVNQDEAADIIVEHCCSASIGVVMFISHEDSKEEALSRADAAMYQAKDAGRNQVRFYEAKN